MSNIYDEYDYEIKGHKITIEKRLSKEQEKKIKEEIHIIENKWNYILSEVSNDTYQYGITTNRRNLYDNSRDILNHLQIKSIKYKIINEEKSLFIFCIDLKIPYDDKVPETKIFIENNILYIRETKFK